MIVTILKAIGLALLVAVCFALVAGLLLFIVAVIATAKWQSENGEQYYNDEEE